MLDQEYDATGWADLAEFLFFEDYKGKANLSVNVRQFMAEYTNGIDWDSMVSEVQGWHAEYFRRLDNPSNNGKRCIQGVRLQEALFACIKSLLP